MMKVKFNKIKIILVLLVFSLVICNIISSCQSSDDRISREDNSAGANLLQQIDVYNLRQVPLRIAIKGDMIPWKQTQLMVPFKSKIIASLAEPDMKVEKNDLLVSLWQYSQKYEYTPLNLLAPYDGIVASYNYKIGDEISANQPILTIKNYEYYSITFELKEGQLALVKKWAKAILKLDQKNIEGYILNIFPQRREAVIRVPGSDLPRTEIAQVEGNIEAGTASGSFISDDYFSARNMIKVMVDPNVEINLTRIGTADSLAMIFPSIPDQDKVVLLPIDYDL